MQLFACLGLCFPALANAQQPDDHPTITWLSIDWQPAWINEGRLKGTGYAQVVERLLREHLNGYRHIDQNAINVRIYPTIKTKDACFTPSAYKGADLKVENREGVIWSAPTFLFFYHGLIAHKKATARIQQHQREGLVKLRTLVQDETVVGAFQPGRIYSRWLHDIFEDKELTAKLFRWSGDNQLTQSMFKLLEANRVDYFVDYSLLLNFFEENTGRVGEFQYFPLQEHKDRFGLGAIACSDSEVGRNLIADINNILKSLRHTDEFRQANSRWLMPKGQDELYWRLWNEQLLVLSE